MDVYLINPDIIVSMDVLCTKEERNKYIRDHLEEANGPLTDEQCSGAAFKVFNEFNRIQLKDKAQGMPSFTRNPYPEVEKYQ